MHFQKQIIIKIYHFNANIHCTVKFVKKQRTSKADYNFEHVVTPTFYVAKWKWQAYPAGDQFPIVSKMYLDCILAEPEEGCLCDFFYFIQNKEHNQTTTNNKENNHIR